MLYLYRALPYIKPKRCDFFADGKDLLNKPGIYVITGGDNVLYVGRTYSSIRHRHAQRLTQETASDRKVVQEALKYQDATIHCYPIPLGRWWIRSVEGRLIKRLKPYLNERVEQSMPAITVAEYLLGAVAMMGDGIALMCGLALMAAVGLGLYRVLGMFVR
jgi:hypothetical protein